MKIVLSRKGFDAKYGGMASPILPDGRMLSLPIPSAHDRHTFSDLDVGDIDLGAMLADLSGQRYRLQSRIHMDPDLSRPPATRPEGWRPALGQTGGAQTHLATHRVARGDVFVFFGWFREVTRASGTWRYVRGAPNLHVMFGWVEVDTVLRVVTDRKQCLARHPWIVEHPHVRNPDHYDDPRNTLYVASTRSRYNPAATFGGGRFSRYTEALRLTAPGVSRSQWRLPGWFHPSGRTPLSHHPVGSRWQMQDGFAHLRSAAIGQEFVLDAAQYPEAEGWLADLIGAHA